MKNGRRFGKMNAWCGYANNIGGKPYIGIDDDGNVIAINKAKKTIRKSSKQDKRCTWNRSKCEFVYRK